MAPPDTQKVPINQEVSRDIQTKSGGLTGYTLRQRFMDTYRRTTTYDMGFFDGELRIKPVPSGPQPFAGFFITNRAFLVPEEDADLLGRIIKGKTPYFDDLVNILRIVEPRLERIMIIPSAGQSTLYGDIGLSELLPLSLMGDGIRRLVSILLRIANSINGLVFIDEIENGIHHSVLPNIWKAINDASMVFNTQIFASTHSYESIEAAHKTFTDSNQYDFSLYRIDRTKESIKAIRFDKEMLDTALESFLDVR